MLRLVEKLVRERAFQKLEDLLIGVNREIVPVLLELRKAFNAFAGRETSQLSIEDPASATLSADALSNSTIIIHRTVASAAGQALNLFSGAGEPSLGSKLLLIYWNDTGTAFSLSFDGNVVVSPSVPLVAANSLRIVEFKFVEKSDGTKWWVSIATSLSVAEW